MSRFLNYLDEKCKKKDKKEKIDEAFSPENTKEIYKKIKQKAIEIKALITTYTESNIPKSLARHLYVYMDDIIKEIDKELKKK